MSFIAGTYTVTLNGSSAGQIEDRSLNLEITYEGEGIQGDLLGASVQDWVHRGGNCFVSMTLLEANASAVASAIAPYSAGDLGAIGTPGTFATGYVQPLVLTKRSGPNASPTSFTASRAIIAPGFPVSLALSNTLKRVPLRFQLLPFLHSDNLYRWFYTA